MGTVLYTPALVEQADELRDEAIIKEIILEESNSNMSGDDAKKICIKIKGALAKESCYAQLEGTEKTDYTESELAGYWKAVGRGYTKPITEFVKKKETISKLLGFATSIGSSLSGLMTPDSNQGTDYSLEEMQGETLSRGAKVGIAIGSVVILTTIAYLIFRKK
jgi:hypothetical protein